jgi:hypothetical protein
MAEAQGREKNDLDWDETRGLERYARDVVTMTAAGSVCEDPRRVVAACGSLGVSGFGNRDVAEGVSARHSGCGGMAEER